MHSFIKRDLISKDSSSEKLLFSTSQNGKETRATWKPGYNKGKLWSSWHFKKSETKMIDLIYTDKRPRIFSKPTQFQNSVFIQFGTIYYDQYYTVKPNKLRE